MVRSKGSHHLSCMDVFISSAAIEKNAQDQSTVDTTFNTQVDGEVGGNVLERAKCLCGRLDSFVNDCI